MAESIRKIHKVYILFISLLLFFSCNKDHEKTSWDSHVLAPAITTSLGINDLLTDTLISLNNDQSISLVYKQDLYSITLDSLLQLSTDNFPTYHKNVKLSSLKLDPQTIVRPITLEEMAPQLKPFDGNTMFLPPISNITAGPEDIDANQFFETADLLTGDLTISISNGLPVSIDNVDLQLSNKIPPSDVVVHSTFTNIAPGQTKTNTYDLSGKKVDGSLLANILDLDLSGGIVKINMQDAITITMSITNIQVKSATAIFPAQNVVDEKSDVPLEKMNDVELTEATIKEGYIQLDVTSTAQDTLYFTYSIPGAVRDGQPLLMNAVIPPSTNGSNSKQIKYDISGYTLDLTGKNKNTVNKFYNELTGRIKYTGRVVSLSLEDSIEINVGMNGIKPCYVKGYLGRDTFNIGPSSVNFDVFKRIEGGVLNFESVKFNAYLENGIGVPGVLKINQLSSSSSKHATVMLSGGIVNNDQNILAATDNPLSPSVNIFDISTGSNATDLLNILPDRFNYSITAVANPAGKTGLNQFAYSTSPLKISLDVELPLSIYADQLQLSDTMAFNASSLETVIKSGYLYLLADNGFPLNAKVSLFFLDDNDTFIDSLTSSEMVAAATLDINKKVSAKKFSKVPFYFDQTKASNILRSKKVIIRVVFATASQPDKIKIYSDYKIDLTLSGDLLYNIQTK